MNRGSMNRMTFLIMLLLYAKQALFYLKSNAAWLTHLDQYKKPPKKHPIYIFFLQLQGVDKSLD